MENFYFKWKLKMSKKMSKNRYFHYMYVCVYLNTFIYQCIYNSKLKNLKIGRKMSALIFIIVFDSENLHLFYNSIKSISLK